MSRAPTYEAIKCETSGKSLLRKKTLLSSWALDNRVRMVYCHQSSVMFLREYGDVFNIHLVKHFMFAFNRMISCVISAVT